MKFKYTIFAESNLEEEDLVTKLERVGLTKIFVEIFINIDSLLRDQNKFLDENFDAKWEKIRTSGIIKREEMLEAIENKIDNAERKSMFALMTAINEAGVECELPNAVIGVILSRCVELLEQ